MFHVRVDGLNAKKIFHLNANLTYDVIETELEKFLLDCDPSLERVEVIYHKAKKIFIACGIPHGGVHTDPVDMGEYEFGDFIFDTGVALCYEDFVSLFNFSYIDN